MFVDMDKYPFKYVTIQHKDYDSFECDVVEEKN